MLLGEQPVHRMDWEEAHRIQPELVLQELVLQELVLQRRKYQKGSQYLLEEVRVQKEEEGLRYQTPHRQRFGEQVVGRRATEVAHQVAHNPDRQCRLLEEHLGMHKRFVAPLKARFVAERDLVALVAEQAVLRRTVEHNLEADRSHRKSAEEEDS